jgi:hypothetical protein
MPTQSKVERSEWIVEALLPARHVEFRRTPIGRTVPSKVTNESTSEREARLGELFRYLESVLDVEPVLLRAAGAVGITASPAELRLIASHPLVKRIQPNQHR